MYIRGNKRGVLKLEKRLHPEERLAVAILICAVQDLLTNYGRKYSSGGVPSMLDRRTARLWLASDSEAVFSFKHVCEILGYDVRKVRSKINKMKKEKRQ